MAKKDIQITNSETEVNIDLNEIRRLAELGLTQKDISYILGIRPETLTRLKGNNVELSQVISEGKAVDKRSLIDKMRDLTDKGNNKYNATKYLLSALHGLSETSKVDLTTKGESINKIEVTVKGSKSTLLNKE